MTIIVEGPDGAGKTTLVEKLQRMYNLPTLPRACTPLGGPVDDLAAWVDSTLIAWLHGPIAGIIDRFPLMSDYAYGPIIRGNLSPKFADLTWSTVAIHRLQAVDPLIIFCMPPIEDVRRNVRGDKNQMAGVEENIDRIYAAYQAMIALFNVHFNHVHVYDYVKWGRDFGYQDWFQDQLQTYQNRYPERFTIEATKLH